MTWKFAEIPHPDPYEYEFKVTFGLHDPEDWEEFNRLRDLLRVEFWKLVDESLTDTQRKVLHWTCEGRSMRQICAWLRKDQKRVRRAIGAAKRKLRRLAETNEEIQSILSDISDLKTRIEYRG